MHDIIFEFLSLAEASMWKCNKHIIAATNPIGHIDLLSQSRFSANNVVKQFSLISNRIAIQSLKEDISPLGKSSIWRIRLIKHH